MSSQVDIANRALSKLGQSRITSLSDETAGARVLNSMWETVRDCELRAHVWSFATTRTSLAALSTTPSWGYRYQYQLPSDFLRLIEVDGQMVNLNFFTGSNDSLYKIEGTLILTNLSAPLNIRYIYRVTDCGQYSSDFVEVLASKLAVECCETLKNSQQTKQILMKEYEVAVVNAAMISAFELPSQSIYDDSFLAVRN